MTLRQLIEHYSLGARETATIQEAPPFPRNTRRDFPQRFSSRRPEVGGRDPGSRKSGGLTLPRRIGACEVRSLRGTSDLAALRPMRSRYVRSPAYASDVWDVRPVTGVNVRSLRIASDL